MATETVPNFYKWSAYAGWYFKNLNLKFLRTKNFFEFGGFTTSQGRGAPELRREMSEFFIFEMNVESRNRRRLHPDHITSSKN